MLSNPLTHLLANPFRYLVIEITVKLHLLKTPTYLFNLSANLLIS